MKYKYSYVLDSGIPLGGIGTGSMEIRADGRLYSWTIFNNGGIAERNEDRYKYFLTEFDSFFAYEEGKMIRILHAYDYYFGANPYTRPWIRPAREIEFTGEPPIAYLNYDNEVKLKAFSPFIPLDVKNSSLPVAIFKFSSKKNTRFFLGVNNPFEKGQIEVKEDMVIFKGETTSDDPRYQGNLCIKVIGEDASATAYNQIFDFWDDYKSNSLVKKKGDNLGIVSGKGNDLTFIITWFFPNFILKDGRRVGHYYENFFNSCTEVMDYVIKKLNYLEEKTTQFHDLFYNAEGVDSWIVDLIGAQIATLVKSSWLTKDNFFGIWEGYFDTSDQRKIGKYPYTDGPENTALNTIDVLLYALPGVMLLFPELAKNIVKDLSNRALKEDTPEYVIFSLAFPDNLNKYKEEVRKDPTISTDIKKLYETIKRIVKETGKDPKGRMPHYIRHSLTVDTYERIDINPEFVLLYYLIARYTGDRDFLKSVYEVAKNAIESIIRTQTLDGLPYLTLPSGIEWMRYVNNMLKANDAYKILGYHTLALSMQTLDDWSWLGFSPFVSFLWITALEALNEASKLLNSPQNYEVKELIEKANKYLWNGEYYINWYDPISNLRDDSLNASQITGDWYVQLLGLQEFLDYEKRKSIFSSIIKYNYTEEEGIRNGSSNKEITPLGVKLSVQSKAPWSGVEYYLASHMFYNGFEEYAKKILRNVYERYELAGNFWNHLEWGARYMRPLVAINIIHAIEGMRVNMLDNEVNIDKQKNLKWILLLPTAWGLLGINNGKIRTRIYHGEFKGKINGVEVALRENEEIEF
ncbi:GH116 family glycosyl hydrolase [Sulfolobus sp. E11-6]|uniref:GH116 family glycosyl hydrolase n=1 Tax=Sulfolobus sp. E11-6 TaxID=2663020 RepID=UPI00129668B7|nr:GH116 family glycosyl hydrolase [Sulfolobus sp. E11-6]QGA68118.1 beta-glucosidase [Sulfolobus sp. E11-6]